MATLLDLAHRMKETASLLKSEASRCAVEVAVRIETNLANVTPVDTSNALSNWQVALNDPEMSEIYPYVPGYKGSSQPQSTAMAIAKAKDVLKNKKPGETIFISNNAPYIIDLNNGSSKQASAGFVERAVLVGKLTAKRFKIRLG